MPLTCKKDTWQFIRIPPIQFGENFCHTIPYVMKLWKIFPMIFWSWWWRANDMWRGGVRFGVCMPGNIVSSPIESFNIHVWTSLYKNLLFYLTLIHVWRYCNSVVVYICLFFLFSILLGILKVVSFGYDQL